MDALDLDRLRLSDSDLQALVKRKRPPRHRRGQHFLRGPIPWSWIEVALPLAGRAWHVGTILWYLAGIKKSRTVKLEYGVARAVGLDRYVVRRGLANLEHAGLVQVERKPGRCPVVTILDGKRRSEHGHTANE